MSHPAFLGASELARKIRDREISSLELTDHYINRIEQLDGSINAVVVRDFDRALSAAAKADGELAGGNIAGPLHGVPVTVKEAFNIAGLATTWGVPPLRDNIADTDAEVVKRLRQAGAVFMGKTNVPFGLGDIQTYNEIYGVTNNLRAVRLPRLLRDSVPWKSAPTWPVPSACRRISAGFTVTSRPGV